MTNAATTTTTEWVEARNVVVGDMTEFGPLTEVHVGAHHVALVAKRDGANLATKWNPAPTQYVRVIR